MLLPPNTGLDTGILLESDVKTIPGITYISNYISVEEQNELLNIIDKQIWSTILERRIQHYGYRYEYKNGTLASSSYLGALPDWIQPLVKRLYSDGLTAQIPDQVIVNEYQPGQGITSHIDCVPCFGKTVISLTLGSPCVMDFIHPKTQEKAQIFLAPGCVLALEGEARYIWQHGIAARTKDNYHGREFLRNRRVSMIFREVLFPYK